MKSHKTAFSARPARRHNKLGIVERGNGIIKLFVLRLARDQEFYLKNHGRKRSFEEMLSQAVYLKNLMFGNKVMSSFEQRAMYQPNTLGEGQTPVSMELFKAHEEQVARRTFYKLLRQRD